MGLKEKLNNKYVALATLALFITVWGTTYYEEQQNLEEVKQQLLQQEKSPEEKIKQHMWVVFKLSNEIEDFREVKTQANIQINLRKEKIKETLELADIILKDNVAENIY